MPIYLDFMAENFYISIIKNDPLTDFDLAAGSVRKESRKRAVLKFIIKKLMMAAKIPQDLKNVPPESGTFFFSMHP